jgi:mono/diheme cytochrome c family protein
MEMRNIGWCLVAAMLTAGVWGQEAGPGQKDAGGFRAPTEALERGRVVFVTSSCHFCHGVDLTQTAMGAANLLHSSVVGADTNGNLIGPLVKAGLPALQTSMPSYYEMTPQQITDLASYIHYLRQMGKYAELMAAQLPAGDASRGQAAFNSAAKCSGCHKPASLAPRLKKQPKELEEQLLLPSVARPKEGAAPNAAAQSHSKFTENASPKDVSDLIAYLRALQ